MIWKLQSKPAGILECIKMVAMLMGFFVLLCIELSYTYFDIGVCYINHVK